VDKTIQGVPRCVFAFGVFQDTILAKALYHEIGHHFDATLGSAAASGEAAAEDWSRRLTSIHVRRRYWHLVPLLKAVRTLVRLIRPHVRRWRPPHTPRWRRGGG
jgi:hypothetical protein